MWRRNSANKINKLYIFVLISSISFKAVWFTDVWSHNENIILPLERLNDSLKLLAHQHGARLWLESHWDWVSWEEWKSTNCKDGMKEMEVIMPGSCYYLSVCAKVKPCLQIPSLWVSGGIHHGLKASSKILAQLTSAPCWITLGHEETNVWKQQIVSLLYGCYTSFEPRDER